MIKCDNVRIFFKCGWFNHHLINLYKDPLRILLGWFNHQYLAFYKWLEFGDLPRPHMVIKGDEKKFLVQVWVGHHLGYVFLFTELAASQWDGTHPTNRPFTLRDQLT